MLSFLTNSEADRLARAIRKLLRHDVSGWALTGGIAVELHCRIMGRPTQVRRLNDLDFITQDFAEIPASLAGGFLFNHVHPFDPPGKTLLQFIDRDTALRIDVFRAFGATMSRTIPIELAGLPLRMIALEDLVARAARLTLDLASGTPVAAKYAGDYLRLAELVEPAQVETAWQDQRKPSHPQTFRDVYDRLPGLIMARPDLLMTPGYSSDPIACPRCLPASSFRLADPQVVFSLLGYY